MVSALCEWSYSFWLSLISTYAMCADLCMLWRVIWGMHLTVCKMQMPIRTDQLWVRLTHVIQKCDAFFVLVRILWFVMLLFWKLLCVLQFFLEIAESWPKLYSETETDLFALEHGKTSGFLSKVYILQPVGLFYCCRKSVFCSIKKWSNEAACHSSKASVLWPDVW